MATATAARTEQEEKHEGGVFRSTHPVAQHKLRIMRKSCTTSREFRALLREMTSYLGYEATQDLDTKSVQVKSLTEHWVEGQKVRNHVAVIPILRGGLGMTETMLELLPEAPVYHIGIYRNPGSTVPVQYYNRLPKGVPSDIAIVLDPEITTSKCICATVSMLKKWGAKWIKVVTVCASKQGLDKLTQEHPDVQVYCAAIDEASDDGSFLMPGIGDTGDRLFLGPVYGNEAIGSPIAVPPKRKANEIIPALVMPPVDNGGGR